MSFRFATGELVKVGDVFVTENYKRSYVNEALLQKYLVTKIQNDRVRGKRLDKVSRKPYGEEFDILGTWLNEYYLVEGGKRQSGFGKFVKAKGL